MDASYSHFCGKHFITEDTAVTKYMEAIPETQYVVALLISASTCTLHKQKYCKDSK